MLQKDAKYGIIKVADPHCWATLRCSTKNKEYLIIVAVAPRFIRCWNCGVFPTLHSRSDEGAEWRQYCYGRTPSPHKKLHRHFVAVVIVERSFKIPLPQCLPVDIPFSFPQRVKYDTPPSLPPFRDHAGKSIFVMKQMLCDNMTSFDTLYRFTSTSTSQLLLYLDL